MANRPHHMICLVEYFKPHLRTGRHNRIGTIGTVADDNVFTFILLKLHVVLHLSRTISRPQALKRRSRLNLDRLFTSADRYDLDVHLICDLSHTFFASSARTYKESHIRSMKIRELNRHEDTACCLRDRCVELR